MYPHLIIHQFGKTEEMSGFFWYGIVNMIFSSVAGFLRFTLSFSIFSSSFIIFCFLFSPFVPTPFLFPFHFFPLSLFCFSMLLYPLCSLSLSSTLFFLLVFYSRSPGCRVAGYHCSSSLLEATRIYFQSPRRKWESALHHSKSHPAVRRERV